MIRTGFLRWEIEVEDVRSQQDRMANEVRILARPSYRNVRIKWSHLNSVQERFVNGGGTYAEVLAAKDAEVRHTNIVVPDFGPRVWRYSRSDREKMLKFWMTKLKSFADAVAMEIVGVATSYPQLVISSDVIRSNYARMVETEIMRVLCGKSTPQPTDESGFMEVDVSQQSTNGMPELVAAHLVKEVFDPVHFEEFARKNHVTIKGSDGKTYRIPRRTHGLVQVWDEDRKPQCQLCIVFKDPGMPPSDEVAMKYLLIRHHIDVAWKIGIQFPFTSNVTPLE